MDGEVMDSNIDLATLIWLNGLPAAMPPKYLYLPPSTQAVCRLCREDSITRTAVIGEIHSLGKVLRVRDKAQPHTHTP